MSEQGVCLVTGVGPGTGSALVRGLTEACQHVVVIEIDEFRSNMIQLDNLRLHVPTLHGDARKPLHLPREGEPLRQAVESRTRILSLHRAWNQPAASIPSTRDDAG